MVYGAVNLNLERKGGDHLKECKYGAKNTNKVIQSNIANVTGIAVNISCHASICSSGLMVQSTGTPSFINGQPGIGTSIADIL